MRYGSPLSISDSYEHLQAIVEKGLVNFDTIADFADFAPRKCSISDRIVTPHQPRYFSRAIRAPDCILEPSGGAASARKPAGQVAFPPLADFAILRISLTENRPDLASGESWHPDSIFWCCPSLMAWI